VEEESVVTVIAFDVNETLLDLAALDAPFEDLLGAASLRTQWFAQMLQLSFVGGLTGVYVDFSTAQRAALRMVAERVGRSVTDADVEHIVARMTSLPAYPEVAPALARLRASLLPMVALTNSLHEVAEAQLTNAGIRPYFDRVISADSVRRLKPAPEPYLEVARVFDVEPAAVCLVAAHSWDISGALSAGCQAAFVARPGAVLSPLGPQPAIVSPDLAGVVEQLLVARP
jgi:2-haloacid dehalogenase